jgi:hypothetical protein
MAAETFSFSCPRLEYVYTTNAVVFMHVHRKDLFKMNAFTYHVRHLQKLYPLRRIVSFGMLRRVALVRTDVSEELSAFFIRVTRIGELGTTLALTTDARSSQKTQFFIVTAVKTSNLTLYPLLQHRDKFHVVVSSKSRSICS